MEAGWGDGLPLLPPTERRVRGILASTPFHTDDVVGILPPMHREATIELVAVNAAMAGCEAWGMPYVIAALEAMCAPSFNLEGVTTTTSSVFPYVIVNGPSRDRVGIDYRNGCMGGAAGRGSMTIGRAVSLCLRNIGGQQVGDDVEERVRPAGTASACASASGRSSRRGRPSRSSGGIRATTTSSPCTRPRAPTRSPTSTTTIRAICSTSSRRAWPSRCRTSSSRRPRGTGRR